MTLRIPSKDEMFLLSELADALFRAQVALASEQFQRSDVAVPDAEVRGGIQFFRVGKSGGGRS